MLNTNLLSRLAVTGPSRALDWGIAIEFGIITAREIGDRIWYSRPGKPNFLGVLKTDNNGRGNFGLATTDCRYTESIDDVLRDLLPPDAGWELGRHSTGYWAEIWFDVVYQSRGTTPAIALVIACLKAKEADSKP